LRAGFWARIGPASDIAFKETKSKTAGRREKMRLIENLRCSFVFKVAVLLSFAG
jgi:hypothetical protein